VDLRVVIDKGQVQPLFLSELHDAFKQNEKIICRKRDFYTDRLKVKAQSYPRSGGMVGWMRFLKLW